MSRQSYTDKRRAQLKRKFELLDQLEKRSTITEPISVLGLSMTAFRGLVQLGIMSPTAASNALQRPAPLRSAGEQSGQRSARPGLATDFASIAIGFAAAAAGYSRWRLAEHDQRRRRARESASSVRLADARRSLRSPLHPRRRGYRPRGTRQRGPAAAPPWRRAAARATEPCR